MNDNANGFTLLEVLVALTILAISAMAVIGQTAGSLNTLSSLERKTAAIVLAENQINLAIVSDAFPAPGRSTQVVSFNQQRWWLNTEVSATSDPWLRKIEVTVSEGSDDNYPLASLVSYRGRY